MTSNRLENKTNVKRLNGWLIGQSRINNVWGKPQEYTVCEAAAQPSPQDFGVNLAKFCGFSPPLNTYKDNNCDFGEKLWEL